jgi:glycosyltransferase involved in cell wall biosynthesis
LSALKLVILHYHLRPGGIRRVIELAAPHIVRASHGKITSITLASGEAPARNWRDLFVRSLPGLRVDFVIESAFGYFTEQRSKPATLRRTIRSRLVELLEKPDEAPVVWVHNLSLARNLILAQELTRACDDLGIRMLSHHHDWWFDNRWQRLAEAHRAGFRSIDAVARVIFDSARTRHLTINEADAKILRPHFGKNVHWLPNLAEREPMPSVARVRKAKDWLKDEIKINAPVWLLPCRLLRRKNVAEALLLTRWLRPEAWLVTTGGVSSLAEQKYGQRLSLAAQEHGWPLRLSVLCGEKDHMPTVGDLLAASEAVLLTSAQEGFGLPYLEAAAASRPLIARTLPNISPDLERFGFAFPQSYEEILIAPELFDWEAERTRQQKLFVNWLSRFPAPFRKSAGRPPMLESDSHHVPIPFSRLTFTAQLEVLAQPATRSWDSCAPLNRFLSEWRTRAARRKLQITPWPRSAERWLGGRAYGAKFFRAVTTEPRQKRFSAVRVQADFIRSKLEAENIYPLLWHTES